MTEYGEVKFKVRQNALLLREFTIAELVRATDLNPESVRTEVQRLKQEGLVVSESQPGQREALYRLSDDPEKRLALSRSVEAFYPEPPEPILPRPTSRLYKDALQTLEQAKDAESGRRDKLLEEAEHQLEGAWHAEGASRAPELVQAHILRERGRLAYLQGKPESAQERLKQAREIFAEANLESESCLVDEYLVCIEAWRRIKASQSSDAAAQARCVLEALTATEHLAISPLVDLLTGLTLKLSRTLRNRVAEMTLQAETHREVTETHEQVKEMREDLRRLKHELEPRPAFLQEQAGIMNRDQWSKMVQAQSETTKEAYYERSDRRARDTVD